MVLLRIFLLASIAAFSLSGAFAKTFHVSPDGADEQSRDGSSPEHAWASLAYACERVPEGAHTIQLAAGTFVATRTASPKMASPSLGPVASRPASSPRLNGRLAKLPARTTACGHRSRNTLLR